MKHITPTLRGVDGDDSEIAVLDVLTQQLAEQFDLGLVHADDHGLGLKQLANFTHDDQRHIGICITRPDAGLALAALLPTQTIGLTRPLVTGFQPILVELLGDDLADLKEQ